jgi:hypothetical protein
MKYVATLVASDIPNRYRYTRLARPGDMAVPGRP